MKLKRWLSEMFDAKKTQEIDLADVVESFMDVEIRNRWIENVFDMLKNMNIEVDRRLLRGDTKDLTDLCARRQAIQDVLNEVLSARRAVLGTTRSTSHNPKPGFIDLDKVTA